VAAGSIDAAYCKRSAARKAVNDGNLGQTASFSGQTAAAKGYRDDQEAS
jgi:hypothetical protein